MKFIASVLIVSASLQSIHAGNCADPQDPGCCLQTVPVTNADGTVTNTPLGFDSVNGVCTWPAGYTGAGVVPAVASAITSAVVAASTIVPEVSSTVAAVSSAASVAIPETSSAIASAATQAVFEASSTVAAVSSAVEASLSSAIPTLLPSPINATAVSVFEAIVNSTSAVLISVTGTVRDGDFPVETQITRKVTQFFVDTNGASSVSSSVVAIAFSMVLAMF